MYLNNFHYSGKLVNLLTLDLSKNQISKLPSGELIGFYFFFLLDSAESGGLVRPVGWPCYVAHFSRY